MTEEEEVTIRSACRYQLIDGVNKLKKILGSIEFEIEHIVNPSLDIGPLGRLSTDGSSTHKELIRGDLISFTKTLGKINDSLEKLPENLFTDSELLSHGFKGRISSAQAMAFYGGTLDRNTLEKKIEKNNDKITAD